MSEPISYMGYHWLTVDDGIVTIGISEEAAADLLDDITVNLPEQDDILAPGKICGDIESENGTLNLYCPVAGTVIEVNEAVLEDPSLIVDDPMDEGWLFKVEADDPEKIDRISLKSRATTSDDDEDEDDEDLDDDDYEDEEEEDED
jgi:glycine cleavage system H protein